MTETKNWKRMRFKKNKVWQAISSEGQPVVKNGKMLIKYQLEQDYEYWVRPESILPLDDRDQSSDDKSRRARSAAPPKASQRQKTHVSNESVIPQDAICIYTDGASSGNPGPSGIGVVLYYGKYEKEISEFIGIATNNIAELKAIQKGLSALKQRNLPVRVYTDSKYAYGVLALDWKSKKNQDIINSVKDIMSKFKDLKLIKVKGHAGNKGNERADYLATTAIKAAGMGK
jgi:ribonuclease HI